MRLELDLPAHTLDRRASSRLSMYQFIYSLAGLVLGLGCVVGGVLLFLNGVAGTASWTARMLGAESHVGDAAPGAILFVVGLFIVLATRFSVTVSGRANR